MRQFFIYGICLLLLVSVGCAPVISQKQSAESGGTRLFVVRHAEAYKNLPLHSLMSKEKQDSLTQDLFDHTLQTPSVSLLNSV